MNNFYNLTFDVNDIHYTTRSREGGQKKKIINTDVLEFPLLVDIVNPSLGPQRLTEVHEHLALY